MKNRIKKLDRYQKAILLIMALMVLVFTVLYAVRTGRANWALWFGATFLCVLNAVSILFAYELFRFDMSFRIRDPKKAEPSDWQVDKWYISWTALPVVALVGFIAGLTAAV